ncbi:MAG: polygalacturonase, partial [Prevotella sp.]|nr:polygalacturonase [Prevotella sp.]
MKKLKNIFSLLVVALVGLSLAACSNDDLGTNQYQGGVSLNAYGPNPVMRGGQLRFVGSNLDQIASITIPGVGEITNIEVVKSGVPSEIRITVPKDGPQVGYVTLKTKTDQTITTKTQIEYIEGIEVTQIPEETVMPGQTIRIEGDYLNLIYSMAFADGVLVSSDDFVAQDRYYIDVVVPEDAKTGKLEFYTADLTIQRTAKEEEELTYQTIVSEDALTVGLPTTSKIASPRGEAEVEGSITAKAGEQIKLTGTYYNVVSDVTVGGVSVNDLAVAEDGTGITFTLPAEAPSGEIMLICKSGEEVPVGTLETVKPSNCTATPSPVKAGATLTIAGKDMDLVKYVAFPLNKEGYTDVTEGLDVAAEKVTVAVPETAVAGKLVLVMANIKDSVFVEYTLVKPVATSYDKKPVSAGEVLTITGTDLDLVKSVTFGESTAELEEGAVSADGTTLSVKV